MDLFSIGWSVERDLLRAAAREGVSEAEKWAIKRLADGEGLSVDVDRLAPLAKLAGLPWDEMFPRKDV